jgi:predicted nuclease with RNAse H fold
MAAPVPQQTSAEARSLCVVGVDVGGERKGFHAVALRGGGLQGLHTTSDAPELAQWCRSLGAGMIGVDAPCRWSADGRARPAERELMAEGIQCFASPSRERALEHPSNYYGWMLRGEALYRALEPSHPLASGLPSPGQRCCFETFPHAISCQLHRSLGLERAAASRQRLERRALLELCGLACGQLSSIDWIDAALCALAADQAARGGPCLVYGEASSGVLIVPTQVPSRPNP